MCWLLFWTSNKNVFPPIWFNRKFFGFKILMNETIKVRSLNRNCFKSQPHSIIFTYTFKKENQSHFMAGYKTLQHRLGLFQRTNQSKINHTSFKANHKFFIRTKVVNVGPTVQFLSFSAWWRTQRKCIFWKFIILHGFGKIASYWIHICVYMLQCKQASSFWMIYLQKPVQFGHNELFLLL